MSNTDRDARPAENEPATAKPEEQGHAVPGKGQALEPEALHPVAGSAVATGDKMWGPPGPAPKDDK